MHATEAYQRGDGAAAHELSEEGQKHGMQSNRYNEQAAQFVLRAINADSAPDEIDLHGLFVEEAEDVLNQRIQACQQRRETHLHVIVGKGIHSANHVQKLKLAVERLCQQHNFQYSTEPNKGRILITFREGAPSNFPPPPPQQAYYQGNQEYQQQPYQQGQQQGYQQQPYQQGYPQPGYAQQGSQPGYPQQEYQQQGNQEQGKKTAQCIGMVKRHGPGIARKFARSCCEIME